LAGAAFGLAGAFVTSCSAPPPQPSLRSLEQRYFVEFLKRNPVVSTYLGADAYSPELASTAGGLRDYSAEALSAEESLYREILASLQSLDPVRLTADEQVDTALIRSQIQFMLRQTGQRKYQHRSLDTYMAEPFRGVDWQIQGMADLGSGRYGTQEEWLRVIERVRRVPQYLRVAEANLREGIKNDNVPDPRMLDRDGLKTSAANAVYFETTLPELAAKYSESQPWGSKVVTDLREAGRLAGEAQRQLRDFLLASFYAPGGGEPVMLGTYRTDKYAFGEEEYNWALSNNLVERRSAAELFELGAKAVAQTQQMIIEVARRCDSENGWGLKWDTPEKARKSARAVFSRLGADHPKDDAEMIAWYRSKSFDLVEYGRRHALFDIPEDYKLDVVQTPPVLLESIEGAAYYPAPPFKKSGVGRFYVSPTGNDEAHLRENNRASMADLCAHEGFPGHDWHYQFLRTVSDRISGVRWLTPGAVEDSSSMWSDSMVTEGWALYGEQLMAEPQPGAPDGVYSSAERLYQLQGQLLRDARVRIDTGIHTGRMSFDEAVDYYTENVDFLPGACARKETDPEARASCETAWKAIFRYSKWPTQAITYYLGKQAILDLRRQVKEIQGDRFDLRAFHEKVLSGGTIPLAYTREQILSWARSGRPSA